MTNLWNCVRNPWKLSRNNGSNSTRTFCAFSFSKDWVSLTSNIGLSSAMEHDTRELFCRLARDCNYRDEKLRAMFISKADCIARDKIKYCFQSSWTFRKFSETLHVYSNRNFYSRNHVSWKAEGEISNADAIAYCKNSNSSQEVKLQVKFSARKNTLKL